MNYTRKRALLACDFCRHRKRRCDGQNPCSTCRESNADCRYKDLPVERVDSPSSPSEAVVERLSRIEALLEEQGQRLNDLTIQGSGVPSAQSSTFSLPPLYLPPELAAPSPASLSVRSSQGLDSSNLDQAQFLIPHEHSTSANSLLSQPPVRYLVGIREYPKTFFFDIERAHPLPPQLDLLHGSLPNFPSLNPNILDALARNYFALVHPNYPLFSQQTFQQWKTQVYDHGPSETLEMAICCCVWALGSMASLTKDFTSPDEQAERDEVSLNFFQPAFRIIVCQSLWAFKPSLELCQALLLAASYFSHSGRPLHNSKMVYLASRHFLQLLDDRRRDGLDNEYDEKLLRVFWACFMMECDRAAELEVPRSGVEPLADRMSLPRSLDPNEGDDMIYFVAETAIRRLLNRIHSSLYASDNTELPALAEGAATPNSISLGKMLTLSSELNRQLEEWYHSIPGKLRPPIGTENIASERGKILRIRYYAARHIIHRPFVLSVALQQMRVSAASSSSPGPSQAQPPPSFPIPRVVLDKCEVCISSCATYLYNASEILERRSPYMWSFSQSCMASLLVLLMADASPQLRQFSPDIEPLKAMVVSRLKRWATPGSSFEAELKIVEGFTVRDRF